MAARASIIACLTRGVCLLRRCAWSSVGERIRVARLEHGLGGLQMRFAGSGDISVRLPSAAATIARRSRLLSRTGVEIAGRRTGDGFAGRGIEQLASDSSLKIDLLVGRH